MSLLSILQRVSHLPQVLQDCISEYNVDHRPSMKPVLDELCHVYHKRQHSRDAVYVFQELQFTVEPYDIMTCDNCTNYIRSLSPEFELTFYDYRYYYCCNFCVDEAYYNMRKYMARTRTNRI